MILLDSVSSKISGSNKVSTMAKTAETVGFILFFLFALAHARFPSDLLPLNERISIEPSKSLHDQSAAEPITTIVLPSERAETRPILPETYVRATESIPEPKKVSKSNDGTPLEIITFRKMKRHFPRRPFPFVRRCRDQHQSFRPRGSHLQDHKEIPYGNDMILSRSADRRFDPVVRSTTPTRWITVGRFPDEHDDIHMDHRHKHVPVHQRRHDHRHHHHDHRHHRHEQRQIENQDDLKPGFLTGFRKFLAHI